MKMKILLTFIIMALSILVFGTFSASASTIINVSTVSELQSAHPYSSSMDTTWVYTHPSNADSLEITFSSSTETESNYDWIYVIDGNGNQIEKQSGTTLAGQTITVPGNVVKIRLTSDGSVTKNGFIITSINPIIENGPITDLSATVTRSGIDFTFTAPTDAIDVSLEYSINNESWYVANTIEKLTSTSTKASVNNLEKNVKYWFRLNVVGGKKEGVSNTVAKFFGSTSKESFEFSNGTITKYVGTDTYVIIPDSINGIAVTKLGNDSFANCTTVTNVLLPDSVTSIGESAFEGCSSLLEITITEGIKSVGYSAFKNCTSLQTMYYNTNDCYFYNDSFNNIYGNRRYNNTPFEAAGSSDGFHVIIDDEVTNIPEAFLWKSYVSDVTIPESVTYIRSNAFGECGSLINVYIQNVESWLNINFGTGLSNPMRYADEIHVDEGKEIIIPEGTTTIEEYLFYKWGDITKLDIPDSVTSIGTDAFYGCNIQELFCVDLESFLKSNSVAALSKISEKVYLDGELPTEIIIPANISVIPAYAFYNWNNLTSIIIPEGISNIEDYAFYGCANLTNISIPTSIKSFGTYVFSKCSSLPEVIIPNGVSSISGAIFEGCTALSNVTIPESVTTIAYNAFYDCTSLTNIELPINVNDIGSYAFNGCKKLQNITINKNIKSIGKYAFGRCDNLKRVDITDIDAYCRIDCERGIYDSDFTSNNPLCNGAELYENGELVTKVVFPNDITIIGNNFSCYEYLEEVTIPDSVTNLDDYAFYKCINLKNIYIPHNVTYIGENAFDNCTGLEKIVWDSAKNTDFWKGDLIFRSAGKDSGGIDVIIGDTVEYIPGHLFDSYIYDYDPNIRTITIGKNVSAIGEKAFVCGSIESVYYNGTSDQFNSITISEGNTSLTKNTPICFWYVRAYENNELIYEHKNLLDSTFDVSLLPQKTETVMSVFVDSNLEQEFDSSTIINGNTNLYLKYVINKYNHIFKDGEIILKEETVDYGATITPPENPNKENTQQYTYNFLGWNGFSEGITQENREMVFTALYDVTVNQYTYKFLDEDGTVLKEATVDYGTTIELPAYTPKANTQQYTYTFLGWDGYTEGMTVVDDIVFTPYYQETVKQYTYKFLDENGTVLKEATVDYGTTIELPAYTPKANTQQYTYTFLGWNGYTYDMSITDDIIFTPKYEETVNQYTYKFIDENGTILKEETVDYGTIIVAPETPADKDAYTFDYWEGFSNGMTVVGDITFKAVYKYKICNISVFGYEDLKTDVIYNRNYTITPAEKYGYEFLGYYSEENGNGIKLTDETGNSLAVYNTEDNSVVYPYFKDLLCNKVVVSGTDTVTIGDTDVRYTVSLGTDKEDIYYTTIKVKYPKAFILEDVVNKKFDETEIIEITEREDYNIAEILCVYSYDGNAIPPLTPIDAFELCFDVDKTAKEHDVTVEITEDSILMGETEDYSFDSFVNASVSIQPKLAENIVIDGLSRIDEPTQYTTTVFPDYTTDKTVVWSVSDDNVATISEDGVLTPVKNGAVTITATANDGSEVFATKTVDVIAYAQITSISTNGTWTEEFKNGKRNYTIYVGAYVTNFDISARYSKGTLRVNGSTLLSGRSKSETLTDTETTITVERLNVDEMTNITYTLTVIKSSDALISESKTTENGYEFNIVLNKDNVESFENAKLVVALYDDGGKFIGLSPVDVNGSDTKKVVPVEIETPAYTAKIMLWNGLDTLKPLCNATEITLK